MSYDAKFTGNLIKNLRNEMKLTQFETSELMHISESHYKNIENGTANPSITNLTMIADFFNVSVDSLLTPCLSDNNSIKKQLDRLMAQHCSEEQLQLYLDILKSIVASTDQGSISSKKMSTEEIYAKTLAEYHAKLGK